MTTIELINTIFSGLLTLMGGGGLGVFWFYSAKKREAAANASKAEADVTSRYADEWKELYEQRDKRVGELNVKVDQLYADISELRKQMWDLSGRYAKLQAENMEAVFFRCVRRGCTDRIPPHELDEKGKEQ